MRKHLLIAWYNFGSKKFISLLSVLSVAVGILIVGIVFLTSAIDYKYRSQWLPPDVGNRFTCKITRPEIYKDQAHFLKLEQVDALKNDSRGIRSLKATNGFEEKLAIGKKQYPLPIYAVNAGFFDYTGAQFTHRTAPLPEFMQNEDICYMGDDLAKRQYSDEAMGATIPIKGRKFVVKGVVRFPRMSMEFYDSMGIYISPKAYRRFRPFFHGMLQKGIFRVWSIGVLAEPGKNKEAMRTLDRAIRKRLGGGNPFSCTPIKASPEVLRAESEFKTVHIIVWSSVTGALFMIFASVLGIQLAVTLHKKRQIAMNRVFGADDRAIMIQTVLEIVIQAFLGIAIATIAKPLVFPVVLHFIHLDTPEYFDYILAVEAMLVADVVVVVILLATALIPSRRISKLSVIECMK
jgi:ABC-type antimicrobial peptide transport system permease subunit